MFHDESIYPAPHIYDPERYLKDGKLDRSVRDPEERIFGSGRRCELRPLFLALSIHFFPYRADTSLYRICPGRHFAMRTLFLNIACILLLFDIKAPVDGTLEAEFHEMLVR